MPDQSPAAELPTGPRASNTTSIPLPGDPALLQWHLKLVLKGITALRGLRDCLPEASPASEANCALETPDLSRIPQQPSDWHLVNRIPQPEWTAFLRFDAIRALLSDADWAAVNCASDQIRRWLIDLKQAEEIVRARQTDLEFDETFRKTCVSAVPDTPVNRGKFRDCCVYNLAVATFPAERIDELAADCDATIGVLSRLTKRIGEKLKLPMAARDRAETTPNRPDNPTVEPSDEPACIVSLGNRSYRVGTNDAVNVNFSQNNVLQAFLNHGSMDLPLLVDNSRVQHPYKVLKGLQKLPGWGKCIHISSDKELGGCTVSIKAAEQVAPSIASCSLPQ